MVLGVLLMIASPVVLGDRIPSRGSTSPARRQAIEDWNRKTGPARRAAISFCWSSGIALIAGSIGTGLIIAFGVGPGWAFPWRRGWKVVDRFGYRDGVSEFGDGGESLGGRLYLRFSLPKGGSMELAVPKDAYRTVQIGDVVDVKQVGRTARAIRPSRGSPGP
jgi:hypothetical protein